MLGFRQGRYDFVSAPKAEWMEVFFDDAGAWRPDWEGRFVRHSVPFLKTDYIGILVDSASCADIGLSTVDVRVWRAMSMAIDRTLLIRELRAGGASAPLGFVPTGMLGFGPDDGRATCRSATIRMPRAPPRRGGRDRAALEPAGQRPRHQALHGRTQRCSTPGRIRDRRGHRRAAGIDAERVANSEVPLFRKSWPDYPDAENFLGCSTAAGGRRPAPTTPGSPTPPWTACCGAPPTCPMGRSASNPAGCGRPGPRRHARHPVVARRRGSPVSRQWTAEGHRSQPARPRHVERMPSGTP